jgi:hypothetical protein
MLAGMPVALGQSSVADVDRLRFRLDPERTKLEDREGHLKDVFANLQRAEGELQLEIDTLVKKKNQVDDAMDRIRHELNVIHLQLLQ